MEGATTFLKKMLWQVASHTGLSTPRVLITRAHAKVADISYSPSSIFSFLAKETYQKVKHHYQSYHHTLHLPKQRKQTNYPATPTSLCKKISGNLKPETTP
jgi:hypothetical protein